MTFFWECTWKSIHSINWSNIEGKLEGAKGPFARGEACEFTSHAKSRHVRPLFDSYATRLTMSAKFLGSASNSGRGILPRRSGWKPLPLFHWIPTEHFKAGIET